MLLLRTAVVVAFTSVLVCLSAQPYRKLKHSVSQAVGAVTHTQVRRHAGLAESDNETGRIGKRWFFFDGGSLSPVGQRLQPGAAMPVESPSKPPATKDDPTNQDPNVRASPPPQQDPTTVVNVPSQGMRKAVPASKCRLQKKLDRLGNPNAQVDIVQIKSRDIKLQQGGHIANNA